LIQWHTMLDKAEARGNIRRSFTESPYGTSVPAGNPGFGTGDHADDRDEFVGEVEYRRGNGIDPLLRK
jgi:hypothetical protein